MKTTFFKPLAAGSVVALTIFSCAGSNESAGNTGMEPTDVVVTETEVAGTTTPDGAVVIAETEVVADTTILTPEMDPMANTTGVLYDNTFDNMEDTEDYDVLALARVNPNLSTFVQLVEASGLTSSLQVAGPVTLFAPINQAFSDMSEEKLAGLTDPENRAELIKILNLHFLPSEVSSLDFQSNSIIDRGEGEDIPVSVDMNGNAVYVGGAQIIKSDVEASNGILHIVDGIILTSDGAGTDME